MKHAFVLISLLLLASCGTKELEEKLAATEAERQALNEKVISLEAKVSESETQITALKETEAAHKALTEEAEVLREKTAESEAKIASLEPKAAKLPGLEKEVKELKSRLREAQVSTDRLAFLAKQGQGVKATIVTNMGTIEAKFRSDLAPLHVFNFITRAESGFFDNTQFHRVIPGFMIQGGDHLSGDMNFGDDGTGAPLMAIPHEFNNERHKRGVLSMARRSDPRYGAGSQFFIMHGDSPQLDRQYTVFGEVTSGMDVVDRIAKTKRNRRDHPIEPVWIEKVMVRR